MPLLPVSNTSCQISPWIQRSATRGDRETIGLVDSRDAPHAAIYLPAKKIERVMREVVAVAIG